MNKKRLRMLIGTVLVIAAPLTISAGQDQQRREASASRQKAQAFIGAMKSARVIELNFIWDRNSPLLGLNPPYSLGLHTSHKQTKGMIPGGIAFAADMMFFSGQHGSPNVDALGHISHDMKLFGGADAASSEDAAGILRLGIEAYPKERFINRAVLLDVARYKKLDALAPAYEITAEDLEATARAQGVEIQPGDSVLIRTGFGKFFEADRAKYMGPRPGPGEQAARWLAGKRVFLAGDDQMSFEVVTAQGSTFPAHRILIADSGIYIVENLNLEELAAELDRQKAYEFVLVLNPPRIRGATGAAANAFAILPQ
jgi:kynurenine formamidase